MVNAFSIAPRWVAARRQQPGRKLFSTESDECSSPTGKSSIGALYLPSRPDTPIRYIAAPMVAASDYPFRYFLRKHHVVDLCYTQMLHSKNIVKSRNFRNSHLDLWETGKTYPELLVTQRNLLGGLDLDPMSEHTLVPLIVQLAGHDVKTVVRAANIILDHADGNIDGFDLNLGCPQQIAKKGRYGAFLMEQDFDLVCSILSGLRNSIPPSTAVSAKMRLPLDDETLKMRIPRLVGTGINFITVHGRTLYENKTKVGACHIDRIKLVVDAARAVEPTFPVVANGGMETYQDVQDILQSTGAVAAMSSEALLEMPSIFKSSSMVRLAPRELLRRQVGFARDYLHVCATVVPPLPGVLGAVQGGSSCIARGHLFKLLHRYLQEQTDLRERMSGPRAVRTISEMLVLVDELQERYERKPDDELAACHSSKPEASWYRRHRNPDRRVHEKDVNVASDLLLSSQKVLSVEDRKKIVRARIEEMRRQRQDGLVNVSRFV